LGHSDGEPAMSFYQAVAEKWVSYCQGTNKLVSCGKELDGLPRPQIVESVRKPARGLDKTNAQFKGGTRFLTLHPFLSANAIRAGDSMDDIDWCSSNNATPCALRNISVPLLITAMGGHYFIRDNEIYYEVAASRDKDFITPGQYGNSQKNFFDYVARWIQSRF
jgi:hypothetical protein